MALADGARYFHHDYNGVTLPGLYFECPNKKTLILSTQSCGQFYLSAQAQSRDVEAGHELFDCINCPLGRTHADCDDKLMRQPRNRTCTRCGRGDLRLIGRTLCVGCFNRSREVLRGKNSKGSYPARIAAGLHYAHAIIRDESGDDDFEKINDNGLPNITQLEPDFYWITGLFSGREEFDEALARLMPGASIVEFELSPSLLELHQLRGISH